MLVFLVASSSKDYLQNGKRGEGVPSRETQVRSNIGQVGITMTITMTKKQQWVENNNKWGITIRNNDKQGTTTNEEWPHVKKNNHG